MGVAGRHVQINCQRVLCCMNGPRPACPPLPAPVPHPHPCRLSPLTPCPACRCLAGFEPDARRRASMHKRRAKLLAPLDGQLSLQHYLGQVGGAGGAGPTPGGGGLAAHRIRGLRLPSPAVRTPHSLRHDSSPWPLPLPCPRLPSLSPVPCPRLHSLSPGSCRRAASAWSWATCGTRWQTSRRTAALRGQTWCAAGRGSAQSSVDRLPSWPMPMSLLPPTHPSCPPPPPPRASGGRPPPGGHPCLPRLPGHL